MVNSTPPAEFGRLRPATTVALAVLLIVWTGWKLFKLEFFWRYGFFSWQFIGATLLGVVVFLGSLVAILWALERAPRGGP